MPRANLITGALEGQPLETVIAAFRKIAHALARLVREHGVGHRESSRRTSTTATGPG